MRVLIATTELQGTLPTDYFCTVEGELVTPVATQCASPDRCGCGHGFPGLASSRACTTAMIVDRPHITEPELRDAVRDWLDRSGWTDLFRESAACDDPDIDVDACAEAERMLDEVVDEHMSTIDEVCNSFPVGTIVGRHGTLVVSRAHSAAA